YLLQGGFLVIDDFWGTQQWAQFEYEIQQVLPEYEIVDLPLDHNVFTTFYEIDEVIQVPNVGNGTRGGPTWERDGFIPMV
ncbi:MAG TPA: transmembrane prediction, partial [Gemmatimonadetes bacterium]|nr:transmembrane prediction [Gemmatimonadota bacterium]